MTQLLPGDNPQAYIPGDRRRSLARGEDLPTVTHGAGVFVDISGFTVLTEALVRELGGRRGAEVLSANIGRIFAALMEPLHQYDGSVVYFSGDAITAWLDGDDGSRATACALEMQRVMDRVGAVATPAGASVTLGVKVAVAVGRVHRFVVGDPKVQLIDVLAGELMDSLAAAEQQSQPGDVVLDVGAVAALGDRVVIRETRAGSAGPVAVVAALPDPPSAVSAVAIEWPRLPDDVVRQWVLPPVWDRMVVGRGEFLAELRPAVPVFVRFGGLDFDADPDAPAVLDDFVTRAQLALDEQGGSVLQLTIGDKGAYLYGVHGAPIAHEDDAARACTAALRLLEIGQEVPVTDIQVGVATGRLRMGTYGHDQRRTFCCLGEAVNLAARLMTRAEPGTVLVHEDVALAAGDRFDWDDRPDIMVKGRALPLAVRSLRGLASGPRLPGLTAAANPLVGREVELELLRDLRRAAEGGAGQVVVVQAEAGTGKSRLVGELVGEVLHDAGEVTTGEGSPVATQAYAAWRAIWQDLLGLDPLDLEPERVSVAVAELDPSLVARAPLLGPVLGVTMPDSELTASFEGELRKTSLEDLLRRLLVLRAAQEPLTIVVEDGHWLDPLSRDLLAVLSRAVVSSTVLLMVTSRPDGTSLAGLPLPQGSHVTDLVLDSLGEAASTALAVERHRMLTGRDPAPEILQTVVGRAEGNAFYLEQLVDFVVAHAETGDLAVDDLELPASLHSLVLSRIDAQPEGPRRTVKVASVIGRAFRSPLVAAAYPDLGADDDVHDHLVALTGTRLIELEDPSERAFAFGHAVTRDVAYDSLPFSLRATLHGGVGAALEREPDGPRRHLDLLAYHYGLSDDLPKKRHYLVAAADAARTAYANEAAISYLREVLPLVEPEERNRILLDLSEALQVGGDWTAAEEAVAAARQAAAELQDIAGIARSRTARAELDRKQGRYAEAESELAQAEAAFEAVGDERGRAGVLHLRGTLSSQQGHVEEARAAYEASLTIRQALGDDSGVAALLTNLALVAEDEGDFDGAERLGEEALSRRRELGDRRAVSVSLTNMGMLAAVRDQLLLARERFEEAQGLSEEVGDPWLAAVGHHNLGNTTRDLGDLASARQHFGPALAAYVDRDDRWSLAHLLEDVALWLLSGDEGPSADADAAYLLSSAETLRSDIGAPRFTQAQEALDRALGLAQDRTPRAVLESAARDGSEDSLEDALARVQALLSG